MHHACMHATYMKHACYLPIICCYSCYIRYACYPYFDMQFAHALHMSITFILQACLGQHDVSASDMHKISYREVATGDIINVPENYQSSPPALVVKLLFFLLH